MFLCLLLAACAEPPQQVPFDALYGDCATVIDGPVCLLNDNQQLRLSWPADEPRRVEQRVDGRWQGLDASTYADDPPTLRRVLVTTGADRIALITESGHRAELALGQDSTPATLQAGRDEFATPDVDQGVLANKIETLLDDPNLARRGSTQALLGRIYFRLDRGDDAIIAYERAIEANIAEGRSLEALRNTNTLSFLLIGRKADHEQIARRYAQLVLPQPAPAEARYFEDYFVGIAAQENGESRVALRRLARAGDLARRFAWTRRALDSDQALALHLMQIGRFDDAAKLLDAWSARGLPPALSDCEQANFLSNRAWLALLRHEATGDAQGAQALLSAAQPQIDAHCRLGQRVNLRINQAFAHFLNQRFADARAALLEARDLTAQPDRRLQLWALDIDARIAMSDGDLARATDLLEELGTLARVTRSPDARWRAAVGRARLAQAQGDIQNAIALFRAADTQVTNDLLRLPLDAGRDGLVASRRQSRQAHFALLVQEQDIDAAYDLVLRSYADVLALLQSTAGGRDLAAQRSLREYRARRAKLQSDMSRRWSLAQDEKDRLLERSAAIERDLAQLVDQALTQPVAAAPLRTPLTNGEHELAFFLLDGEWIGFVRTQDSVRMAASGCAVDHPTLATCLLAPFSDNIRQAKRLRVLPTGPLWALDFHAHAQDLRDTRQTVPVAYGLALPRLPNHNSDKRALIVADTGGDLPSALAEQTFVREKLDDTPGWTTATLTGRDALSTTLVEQLGDADLFHFAGHARVAGPRGWRSELALGADTSLSVFDILALPAVPRHVVLSGCETAGARGKAAATIGLAQAFVLRGGRAVVAAVREVDDATTLEIMRAFYAAWVDGDDMAGALAIAQQQVSQSLPDADWSAFRIIER